MAEEGVEEDPSKLPTASGEAGVAGDDGGEPATRRSGMTASSTTTPAQAGHEGFVQPSSYLRRPRGQSRPMPSAKPETAVDREQRKGLVTHCQPTERRAAPDVLTCGVRL